MSVAAASRAMICPVTVSPVNAILSTSGCFTSAAPAVSPNPVTTLTTPGGNPARSTSLANSSVVTGVCSAGFRTTVLPAASAGASLKAIISSGEFHGTMAPTTPTASRNV